MRMVYGEGVACWMHVRCEPLGPDAAKPIAIRDKEDQPVIPRETWFVVPRTISDADPIRRRYKFRPEGCDVNLGMLVVNAVESYPLTVVRKMSLEHVIAWVREKERRMERNTISYTDTVP